MPYSIVQAAAGGGASSASFGSDVTAGNSIALVVWLVGSGTLTASGPDFNGSTPSGSSSLAVASGNGSMLYTGIFLMPDVAGGAAGFSISSYTSGSFYDMAAFELGGLGSSPVLDSGGGTSAAAEGGSTAFSSGNTPDLVAASAILIGAAITYGVGTGGGPGSPWAPVSGVQGFAAAGSQVVSSPGSAYAYAESIGSAPGWTAAIAAITAGGGTAHTATASLTVTPSFSAARVRGKYRAGLLQVVPAFASARQVAHVRAAALAVLPRFTETHTGGAARGGGNGYHHYRRPG